MAWPTAAAQVQANWLLQITPTIPSRLRQRNDIVGISVGPRTDEFVCERLNRLVGDVIACGLAADPHAFGDSIELVGYQLAGDIFRQGQFVLT